MHFVLPQTVRSRTARLIATIGCATAIFVSVNSTRSEAQAITFGAQIKAHVTKDASGNIVDQAFTSNDETNLSAANVQYVRLGLVYDSSFVYNSANPGGTGLNSPTFKLVSDTVNLLTHNEKVVLTVVANPTALASQANQYMSTHTGATMDQAVNAVTISDLNVSVGLAVSQFGSRIHAVEIWNEPDGKSWWDITNLGTFNNAMTGICDPSNAPSWGVPVWGYAYSVLPHAAGSGDGSDASVLFDAMRTDSETSCLAAITSHFYTGTPEAFPPQYNNAAGWVSPLPIHLTEFGGISMSGVRTEGQQAQLILRYMLTFLTSSPQPSFTSVYEWKDSCYAPTGAQQYYGITRDAYCDPGTTEKPALTALEQLLPLEAGATYSGGTCGTGVVCSVTLVHPDYTYTFYWRSDNTTTYMNSVISDPTIDEKQLSTTDPFTSRVPSTVPVNQIPRVIRRVTTP